MKYKRSSKNTFSDIYITNISVGVLTILTVLSGLFLSSNLVSADNDSVVDNINITVPVSCTMSGTGMNTHNANINNGTYTPNIGTTTLKAFCNDSEGFAIYAAGYTGNEVGATNSNKLVGTAASSNATIDTGTATSSGNPDISNWAMKLSVVSSPTPTYPITIDSAPNVSGGASASFSDYHTVPNGYTKVAHRDSGTDIGESAEGVTLNTTHAAYISKTQPADTYSGQVIYTLVHPSSASAPVICNPFGTTISTNTSTDIICMQDINSINKTSILSSMTEGQQYSLMDKRDRKNYTVAKLADNNIWMTQNLDHDIVTDGSVIYDSTTTDLPSGTTWIPERTTYSSDTTHWNDYNTVTNPAGVDGHYHPESYDPGDLFWSGILGDNTPTSTGVSHFHLGNYYNVAAAMAMNDISEYDVGQDEYIDINQSICPSGWMLPKNGLENGYDSYYNGSIFYLASFYGWDSDNMSLGDSNTWSLPMKVPLSGSILATYGQNGSLSIDGIGNWGSFHVSGIYMLAFEEYTNYVYSEGEYIVPSDYGPTQMGSSIRCLAR